MKASLRLYLTLILGVSGLWFLADSLFPQTLTWFSFRAVFVQYSGVISIAVMSMAMILAIRSPWLEQKLAGLDKSYRLHKWLGITALVTATAHWWFAKGTKWMVGWGWLERPVRGPRSEVEMSLIESTFREWRGFAEGVGEWAFYIAAALMILALVKRFPYHWFKKTHTLLALGYLALVFHSVILVRFEYWTQPVGWAVALLMLGGSYSALMILFGRVGRSRQVAGKVVAVNRFTELNTLETHVELEQGWQGHKAGQFAFLKTANKAQAHPFTIASAWNEQQQQLVFITKALGDHTRSMMESLKVGDSVQVEGPYGCFDFRDADETNERQVWIAGGIGITPFVARMKDMAANGSGVKEVDLFHCTSDVDEEVFERLKVDAAAAGIRLHLVISGIDERLTAKQLMAMIPGWKRASVWFCGPAQFGRSLKKDLVAGGLSSDNYHQELFEMR